ncbi:MAG: ABC transporter ATP-binding protein [Firmicutes bacterium]|nr:ABC transporter ATP-binding protein [Bacillota bacterium]
MSVTIKINNAVKRYGNDTVIPDLSLTVKEGEFFTLLGPSGCGKTTLLRMIAGFNTIEGGEFYFNDKLINNLAPRVRNIGMVFQNYAIFPHMSTAKNVGFGLKQRKVKNPELSQRVDEILDVVQISNLKDRMPANMSGGQQQRIALARAIVIQPDVLLMDEPLSNLDAKLRVEMRSAIKQIQNQYKITTIYVTHDQEEALAMSDRIAVMQAGEIQQVGTPIEIYNRPANLFTATFIGQTNLLDGVLTSKTGDLLIRLHDGTMVRPAQLSSDSSEGQQVSVSVRPHGFKFAASGLRGKIVESTFLGSISKYTVELDNKQLVQVVNEAGEKILPAGEEVHLGFEANDANVFDVDTEVSLMKDVRLSETA